MYFHFVRILQAGLVMETKNSWILGWLLALGVVVSGLSGCGGRETIDEGYDVKGMGFPSDTTAMLLVQYWEQFEERCCYPGGKSDGYDYLSLGLMLVDVRFQKVYWEAKVDIKTMGSGGGAQQWSDSTMLFKTTQGNWLWTVGQAKPKKLELAWETDSVDILDMQIRPWKGGVFLLNPHSTRLSLDTADWTVRKWLPTDTEAWTDSCDDYRWFKGVGQCLMTTTKPCGYALLQEASDTLEKYEYTQGCSSLAYFSFRNQFIELDLFNSSYPVEGVSSAMIRMEGNENITRKPSFWLYYTNRGFVDSLGSIVGY